jgi:hypothetical protein
MPENSSTYFAARAAEKSRKNLEILWARGIKGLERVLRPNHVLEISRSKNSMHILSGRLIAGPGA